MLKIFGSDFEPCHVILSVTWSSLPHGTAATKHRDVEKTVSSAAH